MESDDSPSEDVKSDVDDDEVDDVEDHEEGDTDASFDAEESKTAHFTGSKVSNITKEYGLGFWFKFQGP